MNVSSFFENKQNWYNFSKINHEEIVRTQINKIINKEETLKLITEMQRIIRNCYEELCQQITDLEERYKSLHIGNYQDWIMRKDNLERIITSNEIESVINCSPSKKNL